VTQLSSSASLRHLYQEWVEEQLEEFKDSVPRSELLEIADQVVAALQVNRKGQYQLTELLLMEEVDRTLFRRLKLPGFAAWAAAYRESPPRGATREIHAGDPERGDAESSAALPENPPFELREARVASL
jgi:hypothetical protein